MTDTAMINALACRMFDGYNVQVSSQYDEIIEKVREENKITRKLSQEIRELIATNFMVHHSKYSIYKVIAPELQDRFAKWEGDFSVRHIVTNSGYDLVPYWRADETIYDDFIIDLLRAEQATEFAENMITQGKEGMVVTLPVKENLVKLLANYENNKSRADKFMEEEFPERLKEVEAYREKLREIKKVVEDLLEERNRKTKPKPVEVKKVETKDNVSVEVVVKVNGDVVQMNKSLCQRFTDWWKSV